MEAKFGPLEKRIKKRLTSIETKFFRRTAVCTLFNHKRNEEVLEELKVEPVDQKLRRYRIKLATTRNRNRMTNITVNCRPNGGRRLGRPFTRQLD